MDEPLIWTRDEILRFTHDAREGVRSWAWSWLARHHPLEAVRDVVRGIADPYVGVAWTALAAFEAHPTPESVKAVSDLRAREDISRKVRAAIEAALQPGGRKSPPPSAFEVECERLSRAPEELRRRAPSMLLSKDYDDHLLATGALGNQQHAWATDILLADFAALLTSRDDTEVWSTLDGLRDPRCLPAILAAWVPGEHRAACLYETIHYLAGLTGPLPEALVRDVEDAARHREERRALYAANPNGPSPGARHPAACQVCGRTGEYERAIPFPFSLLIPGRGKSKPTFGEDSVMVCKFCGARNPDRLESIAAAKGERGGKN